ncbi:MAG: 1-deoxy-D-xylulose-5-phosphate reductoisomerase [Planctomycetes bacterium]|nr:1-deoxy-D-xylulose-5-phosphate reductoisomerase [Planctomycetota bacterium]
MTNSPANVVILGSTGSIGRSALEVIRASGGTLRAVALSANSSLDELAQQARDFQPSQIIATDAEQAAARDWSDLPKHTELLVGSEGIARAVSEREVDVVLSAIVGSAGLAGTWAAIEAGKQVALANKETMVTAGPLIGPLAEKNGAKIIPVDSEHSAVFQALQSGQPHEVRRIVLTASGGPFRDRDAESLVGVTVDEALAHPTWDMGPKITIDSATLMNKALEIIEARWLFDLRADQIDVVIHPQSIVHSMVEFVDGSVIAQMSPPDMKLPIQYALTYPHRRACPAQRLDLTRAIDLRFEPPDLDRFDALRIGLEVARAGGTAGAVINAANEAAVAGFLAGDLGFAEIVPACRSILEHHDFEPAPTLERLLQLDHWARREVSRWVCT